MVLPAVLPTLWWQYILGTYHNCHTSLSNAVTVTVTWFRT